MGGGSVPAGDVIPISSFVDGVCRRRREATAVLSKPPCRFVGRDGSEAVAYAGVFYNREMRSSRWKMSSLGRLE